MEDVEEAKKYMVTLIDQVEDVDEVAQSKDESKDEYTVKFIPSQVDESQIDQPQPFVDEINESPAQ